MFHKSGNTAGCMYLFGWQVREYMTRQFVSRIYQNDSVPFKLQVMYDVEINCKKKMKLGFKYCVRLEVQDKSFIDKNVTFFWNIIFEIL